VRTRRGLMVAKASMRRLVEGMRPRKVMWQPREKGKMNSKAQPNMCARGRKERMVSPGKRKTFFC